MTCEQETRICFNSMRHMKSISSPISNKNLRWLMIVLLMFTYNREGATAVIKEGDYYWPNGCKGDYNQTAYDVLDGVCYTCLQDFDISLKFACRKNCFANEIFGECVKYLMIEEEEIEKYKNYIKWIHGVDPKTGKA